MRVFMTGATGFIGSAIVRELLEAGHQVTGLARSEASAQKLLKMGASVQRGSIEDLECLRRGAAEVDAAVHVAFYHDIMHMPIYTRLNVLLGGSPRGIAPRFFSAAVRADRHAIETLGEALAGRDSSFVAAFGTLAMQPGHLASEDEAHDPTSLGSVRADSENIVRAFASRSVRASVVRLPPVVHGSGDHGFATRLINIARRHRESAYIGDGSNRWPSVHRLDVACLFRLVLERGAAGMTYHAVAEEGIRFRDIAELIGGRVNVPIVSKRAEDAAKQFGFLAPFVSIDNPVSSSLTRERLGWFPEQLGLLSDLDQVYF